MEDTIWKTAHLKNTRKRQLILSILEASNVPVTAEEIYLQTTGELHMNPSTVYRTLNALADHNIALKNISQDGRTYYQLNTHNHHHQIICTQCSKTVPIDTCPLEAMETALMKQTGYQITGHNLEFSGVCPACAQKAAKKRIFPE